MAGKLLREKQFSFHDNILKGSEKQSPEKSMQKKDF